MFKLMKKLLSICALLVILTVEAQYTQPTGVTYSSKTAKFQNTDKESQIATNDDSEGFAMEAKKNNIA